uniref:C2H2-type domain-containing protein n=1 Tax=Cacopsylla melanoneura TaxID=428564 RepID=A0A8D8LVQ8_9HEMI
MGSPNKFCKTCNKFYSKRRKHLTTTSHMRNSQKGKEKCILINSAFKNGIQTFLIKNINYKSISSFLKKCCKKLFISQTSMLLEENKSFKGGVYLKCHFKKIDCEDGEEFMFKSPNIIITVSVNLKEIWLSICESLTNELGTFEGKGSGWTLSSIDALEIRYTKYQPIKGSSYISLPDLVRNTRSVVNFKNNDNFCFKYAILTKHVKRIISVNSFREHQDKYNWNGLSWPLSVDDIDIFEKNNKSLSVHVFTIDDDGTIVPYRLSKKEKENHFDLLLLTNGEKWHFAYIKNFTKFISCQIPTDIKQKKKKIFICKKCFLYHLTEQSLDTHRCRSYRRNMNQSYNNTIPSNLKATHALVCFDYSINTFKNCLLYATNNEDTFDWTSVDEQTTLQQINKFEKKNPNTSINVFGLGETDKDIAILKSCEKDKNQHFNLLLTKNNKGEYFYSYIKSLNTFLYRFVSKSMSKKYICKLCFSNFQSNENLTVHRRDCMRNPPVKVEMPGPDNNILKFENFQHLQKVDFVIYLDMECLLETHDTVEPNQSNSFTIPYQSHKPYSFAYYISWVRYLKKKQSKYTITSEEVCWRHG